MMLIRRKTNLQDAFLVQRDAVSVDISDAEFFKADLTMASLKNTTAPKSDFYQVRFTSTALKGADLNTVTLHLGQIDLLFVHDVLSNYTERAVSPRVSTSS
jgi:uncharacterized protein YjbI with pentapeptide repeats